jgi:hypothetical protein
MMTTREYYENRRDKAFEISMHYSTIRMNMLAFVLPLGGVLYATTVQAGPGVGPGVRSAGFLLILAGVGANWVFAAISLFWLIRYRHQERWLRSQAGKLVSDIYQGPKSVIVRI